MGSKTAFYSNRNEDVAVVSQIVIQSRVARGKIAAGDPIQITGPSVVSRFTKDHVMYHM